MQQRRAYAYLGAVWGAILVSRGQVPDTTQNKSYRCLETQMEKLKAQDWRPAVLPEVSAKALEEVGFIWEELSLQGTVRGECSLPWSLWRV